MYSDENYVIRKETWYTTVDYVGKETSVRVPADLEDDHGCFRDHEEIEEIIYTNGNKTLNGFSGCKNLKRLFISATVEKLGYQPFESCESLTEVTIDPDNAHFTAENSLILSKDGEKLLYCVPGITGTVIVPNSVRCIESNAFSDCRKIEKIVLPKELESIEGYAFGNCVNLKEINLPEKINTLPDYCFIGCKSLDKIDLSHVTCLRKGAFDSCKSLRITVPANVDVIYEGAFAGCTLKNLRFEEGAGLICYGQGAFAESVQVKKKLKTYPNLPLHLFNKPALKLWLVMGFCTDPEVYSGYIKKEYEQYAKSQKKRILKKALEDKQTKVLSYYGESAPETTPEVSRESEGQISLSMTNEQAKQLFKFSKRKTGISINEFKGINSVWRSQSVYDSDFLEGVSNKLILPEYIDGKPVGHIAHTMLPDNAVIFCSDIVFQKLKRSVRTSTACAYLESSAEFPEKESVEIKKFIAKYPADMADKLLEKANIQAVARFFDLVKITPKLCDEMLKKADGNAELTALILDRKNTGTNTKQGKAKKKSDSTFDVLTFEEKPLPVSELKKLWTYSLYITAENPDEKLVELKHYKGHEKRVSIPAKFGKNRLGKIRGLLLDGHDDVTEIIFPEGDYEMTASFRNCKALADPDGFIVVHIGSRSILTDYIGNRDLYTLRLPEGITEIGKDAFDKLRIREAVIPKGCERIGFSAFSGCECLQRVILPDGLKEIDGLAFSDCSSLKDIYIPSSVTSIGWQHTFTRIHGSAGSEAQAYANQLKLTFIEQNAPEYSQPLSDFVIESEALEKYLGNDVTVTVPSGVKIIGYGSFKGCATIREIILPEGVDRIDSYSFMECSHMEAIQIPETVKEIGDCAFIWCSKLKILRIPDSVTSIGKDIVTDFNKIEIHAPAGSYAEQYAKENNIPFVTE